MRFFFPVLIFVFGVIGASEQTWKKREDDFPGRPAKEESSYQDMPVVVHAVGGKLERLPSTKASIDVRKVKKPSKIKRLLSCCASIK